MPKIPMYKRQVALSAGQLGARANQQSFTQVGRAFSQLGEQVTRSATAAASIKQRHFAAEEKAKERRLAEKKVLAEAQAAAAAKGLWQDIRAGVVEKQSEILRDPTVTSIADADARMEELTEASRSEVNKLHSDGLIDDITHQNMLTDHTALMSQVGVSVGLHGFNNAKTKAQLSFNKGVEIDRAEVRLDPSQLPLLVAKYEDEYDSNVMNGIELQNPDSYELSLHTETLDAFVQDDSTSYNSLEAKLDEIENAEGQYSNLELSARSSLAGIVSDAIEEKKTIKGSQAKTSLENGLTSFSIARTKEQVNASIKQVEASVATYELIDDKENALVAKNHLTAMKAVTPALQELSSSSPTEINQALDEAESNLMDSVGTAGVGAQLAAKKALQERAEAQKELISEDPALFSTEVLKDKFPNSEPTQQMIINHQLKVGVSPDNVKAFTAAEVGKVMEDIGASQNPQELSEKIDALLANGNSEIVMRQLRENGLSVSQMFIAKTPNSPLAQAALIASTSDAVVGANAPTKTQRKFIENAVQNNEVFRSQISSMGGELMIGMTDDEVMAMGVNTPEMNNAMSGMKSMIADTAIYLAAQDGQRFGEGGITTPEEMAKYVEQASKILSQTYSYTDVNGGSVRLPKSFEGQETGVKYGIDFIVQTLEEDDIYFEMDGLLEGTPEYDAAKSVYVSELRNNYRVITQNGDRSAIITDKSGGAIILQNRLAPGPNAPSDEPFSVTFSSAVKASQKEGRARLDEYRSQAQELARQIMSHPKKGAENQAKVEALKEQRLQIIESSNAYSRYLRGKGL